MMEILKNILSRILDDLGWNFLLQINFAYIFYIVFAGASVLAVYLVAWRRLEHYSRLMDNKVMHLWEKEEYAVAKAGVSEEVRRIRLERLKEEYREEIERIRKKRDRIFKFVPFMKFIYKKKKGKNAPMYTLP
ncbi:MAG: hypothetical protein ACLFNR_02330 [Candidatus Paceibacterota bacterium]